MPDRPPPLQPDTWDRDHGTSTPARGPIACDRCAGAAESLHDDGEALLCRRCMREFAAAMAPDDAARVRLIRPRLDLLTK